MHYIDCHLFFEFRTNTFFHFRYALYYSALTFGFIFSCFTLKIITNGIYRSIEHRAIVNNEKERLSIATFCSPKHDSILGPMESLISKQTPALFTKIGVKEYFTNLFARKLEGKSYIDLMRI